MSETTESPEMLHRKMDAEIYNSLALTAKLNAETAKISAETSRINQDIKAHPWMPLVLALVPAALGGAGVVGAIVALVVAFHK